MTEKSSSGKKQTQAQRIKSLEERVGKLLTQVANLAGMLEKHMNEADAHHTAMLAKKKAKK